MKEKRNKGDIFISLWIALGVIIILGFFVFSMIIGGSAGLGFRPVLFRTREPKNNTTHSGGVIFYLPLPACAGNPAAHTRCLTDCPVGQSVVATPSAAGGG